ncbi:hypothetical protein HaLaN_07069 [Haematococcus lacustris]|uniref:Uncharacterized protein n=1 Tax=Haematococcus lacustris TaxID=44745 RepID=A0A699YQP7_HAELA|nr:hypothetical protein HaLaN_07069 [Haematococcus lacustris]
MADGAKELIGDIVAGIVGNLPLKDWSKLTEEAWGQPPGATTCPLHDVLQPHTAQPALPPPQCSACSPSSSSGLGVPLHMGAVKLYEHSRLPGSGQVDTPNSYSGFRVGPVLLGCFMLPRVPLHMLRLASRRQAMGTWVLWDPRLLLTPADLDCILSTAPKPPATSPTWPGTCVTNFQTLDISTHQRLGSAMLGHLQAPPGTLFAPHNPLAEATLQLDLAARCHSISPFSPDVVHTAAEDDSAYTPAATLTARVVLMPDGTLHPAPAAADSGRLTSTHLALTLSERLQAEGRVVPQPQLVDQWPVDMHGLASGGVLCGMLLHPVIGRATFFD